MDRLESCKESTSACSILPWLNMRSRKSTKMDAKGCQLASRARQTDERSEGYKTLSSVEDTVSSTWSDPNVMETDEILAKANSLVFGVMRDITLFDYKPIPNFHYRITSDI